MPRHRIQSTRIINIYFSKMNYFSNFDYIHEVNDIVFVSYNRPVTRFFLDNKGYWSGICKGLGWGVTLERILRSICLCNMYRFHFKHIKQSVIIVLLNVMAPIKWKGKLAKLSVVCVHVKFNINVCFTSIYFSENTTANPKCK